MDEEVEESVQTRYNAADNPWESVLDPNSGEYYWVSTLKGGGYLPHNCPATINTLVAFVLHHARPRCQPASSTHLSILTQSPSSPPPPPPPPPSPPRRLRHVSSTRPRAKPSGPHLSATSTTAMAMGSWSSTMMAGTRLRYKRIAVCTSPGAGSWQLPRSVTVWSRPLGPALRLACPWECLRVQLACLEIGPGYRTWVSCDEL